MCAHWWNATWNRKFEAEFLVRTKSFHVISTHGLIWNMTYRMIFKFGFTRVYACLYWSSVPSILVQCVCYTCWEHGGSHMRIKNFRQDFGWVRLLVNSLFCAVTHVILCAHWGEYRGHKNVRDRSPMWLLVKGYGQQNILLYFKYLVWKYI